MKTEILAARMEQAQKRIVAAANSLAGCLGLPRPEVGQPHRDPQLQVLFRGEALAAFLETAVSHLQQPPDSSTVHVDSSPVGYPPLDAAKAADAFNKAELVAHLVNVFNQGSAVFEAMTKAEMIHLMGLSIQEATDLLHAPA